MENIQKIIQQVMQGLSHHDQDLLLKGIIKKHLGKIDEDFWIQFDKEEITIITSSATILYHLKMKIPKLKKEIQQQFPQIQQVKTKIGRKI